MKTQVHFPFANTTKLSSASRRLKPAGNARAILLLLLLTPPAVLAQGTVNFSNYAPASGVNAPVFGTDRTTKLEGTGYLAQLYYGPYGSAETALEPVGNPLPFRTGLGAGYVIGDSQAVVIPGIPGGEIAMFQFRAWDLSTGGTYETATIRGKSPLFSLAPGNKGLPPTPPVDLIGLESFALRAAPLIQQQPLSLVGYWGKGALLQANVTGTGPLTYQWFKNGVPIPGATSATLAFSGLELSDEGSYTVEVSNAVGSVTSQAAFVKVNAAEVSIGLTDNLCAGLIIEGVAGRVYAIQHLTNLAQTNAWITLTNLTLTNSVQVWIDVEGDTQSPGKSTRFYQVVPGQ
ncbi:MAG: immunoglobulin domain-containing protein [Candidatus Omnitrophica bacterium]|nr:immunoglobulin domain-containing protein [Candidatus Omnitrophota bacterium]